MKTWLKVSLIIIGVMIFLFIAGTIIMSLFIVEVIEEVEEQKQENIDIYNSISKGMSMSEVLSAVGEADDKQFYDMGEYQPFDECWYYGWQVQVCFKDGEVTSKAKY